MLTAIVGINWGDEGKGRMVDLLAGEQDAVVRYQGGNNAGHTVINHRGRFVLNLLPSGILREGVVNVMGNGMVVDLEHLSKEIERLRQGGVSVTPENLKISEKAVICMPYHRLQDCMEEDRLKDARFGSTRRGIGPVYGDKYMKKAIRMGELLDPAGLKDRLYALVEWKNLLFAGYGAKKIDPAEMWEWLLQYGEPVKDMICDAGSYLDGELSKGKNVMLEAQLGALRDIEFGIYPYTSSSTTLAAYGPVGAGIPHRKLERVVGVMKAYSTCVGEGPFTAEWFGEEAERLREAGGEYGAATGRPRRVGPFDAVASRYGAKVQGATEIALTKLDVLSYMDEIPICGRYEVDGELTDAFPTGSALNRAKPVFTSMPGWKKDISACRTMESLPKEARAYISALEEAVNCPITMISVGPGREDIIFRRPGE